VLINVFILVNRCGDCSKNVPCTAAIGAPSSFGLRALLFLLLSAHLVAVSEQLLLRAPSNGCCAAATGRTVNISLLLAKSWFYLR
jgi:hypothetical protein